MKYSRTIFTIGLLTFIFSCSSNQHSERPTEEVSTATTSSPSTSEGNHIDNSLHIDSTYKYEFRTGKSGNHEYNYDVEGEDEDGNRVTGNINVSGKYGTGTITDENGDEQEIDVEWVDYGKLEGTDENNKTYELEVE